MNFFDPLLKPWKVLGDGIRESAKDAKASKGKHRHDSFLSGIGKLTDPLTFVLGEKYTDLIHEKIPRELNRAAEPVVQFGHNLNPLYHVAKNNDIKWGNKVHEFGSNKGADIMGIVAGGIAAGMALGGTTGAAGGGASSPSAPASGGAPWANFNYRDPNSYMQLSKQMPSQGGSAPQEPPRDYVEEAHRAYEETMQRRKKLRDIFWGAQP